MSLKVKTEFVVYILYRR